MELEANAHYYFAKAACYCCLSVNEIVNTGLQIEGEGILGICRSCAADIARTAGFELFDRSDELAEYKERVYASEQRALTAESIVVGIAEAAEKVKANREQLADARAKAHAKKAKYVGVHLMWHQQGFTDEQIADKQAALDVQLAEANA